MGGGRRGERRVSLHIVAAVSRSHFPRRHFFSIFRSVCLRRIPRCSFLPRASPRSDVLIIRMEMEFARARSDVLSSLSAHNRKSEGAHARFRLNPGSTRPSLRSTVRAVNESRTAANVRKIHARWLGTGLIYISDYAERYLGFIVPVRITPTNYLVEPCARARSRQPASRSFIAIITRGGKRYCAREIVLQAGHSKTDQISRPRNPLNVRVT